MSSTTRVGFLAPDVTDLADEVLYFDNNVTVYENELPIPLVLALPVSGNYAGRVRAIDSPAVTTPPRPDRPFDGMLYNGTAWVPCGSAGMRSSLAKNTMGDGSTVPNTTSTEVFQSSPEPNFSGINVTAGQVLKFMCNFNVGWVPSAGTDGTDTMSIVGALNIFIDPNSSTQPTPSTAGVVKLSNQIAYQQDYFVAHNYGGGYQPFYCEMFYLATTTRTIGVSAYLSATTVNMGPGGTCSIKDAAGTVLGGAGTGVSLGIGSTQMIIETLGVVSS